MNSDIYFYQPNDNYRINEDSIALCDFIPRNLYSQSILDIGSGTNIIPVILGKKGFKNIISIEIQKCFAPYASDNIINNALDNQISFFLADARLKYIPFTGDITENIVTNPPYFKPENSRPPKTRSLAISRQEIKFNDRLLFESASYLLKKGGNLFISIANIRLNDYLNQFRIGFTLLDQKHISRKSTLLWFKKN